MKHKHFSDILLEAVEQPDTRDVGIRVGIGKKDGAPNFAMRLFHVAPGGHTPFHRHDWEHEVFVVAGKGALLLERQERKLEEGDFVFVEPNRLHQFRNTGSEEFRFICVVPEM